jgi:hypothetical protein
MYLSESFPHLTPCVLSFSYKGLVACDRYFCLKAYKTKLERWALKISVFCGKTKFFLASLKLFLQNSFQTPFLIDILRELFWNKTPKKAAFEMSTLADFSCKQDGGEHWRNRTYEELIFLH